MLRPEIDHGHLKTSGLKFSGLQPHYCVLYFQDSSECQLLASLETRFQRFNFQRGLSLNRDV